jgi:hypothetical protein
MRYDIESLLGYIMKCGDYLRISRKFYDTWDGIYGDSGRVYDS